MDISTIFSTIIFIAQLILLLTIFSILAWLVWKNIIKKAFNWVRGVISQK